MCPSKQKKSNIAQLRMRSAVILLISGHLKL